MRKAFLTLHGVRTLVTETGERKALICLHGWGASHASFQELREALRDDPVRVIAPDLPGCGESGDPPSPWGVDDYVLWLEALMTALHVERCSLLGHSHGGRIAIAYSAKQPLCLQHLYLCAAAGIGRDASRRSLLSMRIRVTILPVPWRQHRSPDGLVSERERNSYPQRPLATLGVTGGSVRMLTPLRPAYIV